MDKVCWYHLEYVYRLSSLKIKSKKRFSSVQLLTSFFPNYNEKIIQIKKDNKKQRNNKHFLSISFSFSFSFSTNKLHFEP